jgi:Carbohydrate-selective porin, OprB family/S-layer homology domain
MSNNLWKSLLATPALLSATLTVSAGLVMAGAATATDAPKPESASLSANAPVQFADASQADGASLDQVKTYSSEGTGNVEVGQVTSVSQLSDVRPTDWAFQALQSLVERYGCIAGYPDKTYRGNRAMTRFEFAAGVNACLDRVNELIAASTADLVKKEDLATLQKLQEEFAAELATLRGRVDSLEARATTLEKQQFSTTTKLRGEAIFAVSGAVGDGKAINSDQQRNGLGDRTDVQENTTFSNRVRLSLNTSFSGKDLLLTRIQARNVVPFGRGATPDTNVTGTNMTRLSFDGNENNQAFIDKLYYRFPLGKSTIQFDAVNNEFYNNVPNFNSLFASDGQGTISRFGRFNPIYRQGQGGSGATINFKPSDQFTVSAGYAARGANDPTDKNGLFNGSNAFLAQVAFQPTKDIGLGFTYVRSYNRDNNNNPLTAAIGTDFGDRPFAATPTSGNHFGIEGSIRLKPGIVIGGWVGYTEAKAEENLVLGAGAAARQVAAKGDNASIWNWAVTLAFPDLGKKGNMGGIIFGMPPKVTSTDYNDPLTGNRRLDRSTSFHLEGLYRYQLSDNISITPGILVIFNPEHNADNDTVYVGTVRTTFTF